MASTAALPFLALGIEGKVDHHDPVLLHDADEEDDADEGDNAELGAEHEEGEECAHPGGRQGGEDRDGVNVAFIEDAEDDVDHYEGREDEEGLVGEGCPEDLGRPLEAPADAGRQLQPAHRFFHRLHRLPEGRALLRIEGDGDRRELPLTAHEERARCLGHLGEGGERDLTAACAAKIDGSQLRRVLHVLGLDAEDDPVLVQLRKNGRYHPLPVGVVKGIVDGLRQDAEARSGAPVDGYVEAKSLVLLIAAHVPELGRSFSASTSFGAQLLSSFASGSSMVYWNWVRLTRASTVRSCTGCMKERDAFDLRHLRLKAGDQALAQGTWNP